MSHDNQRAAWRAETLAAKGGGAEDAASGGVVPPIQPATTFARGPDNRLLHAENHYARDDNPTFRPAEALIRDLEGGAEARLFASGMAAAAAVFRALDRPRHVVAQAPIYYGATAWIAAFCDRQGVALTTFRGADPDALGRALRPGETSLVWVETPSNPLLEVVDIEAAARAAHDAGARLAVDNTTATPILTRPLALGADVAMHSATKYLNGHSDVLAGALCTARLDDPWRAICAERHDAGAVIGAFEAWLLLRGMRTLALRVRAASANALALARAVHGHRALAAVLYPGLESHPGHAIARRQMDGAFGGLMSIRLRGGAAAALAVVSRLRAFTPATSLGGVESLVEHRATVEPPGPGAPPDLLRLSVGVEHIDDLRTDLLHALDQVA